MVNLENAQIKRLRFPASPDHSIAFHVLRLDKIHAIVSGNKWFKLKYNYQQAITNNKNSLVTFGGAWSNHIVATAFMAKENGLSSAGFIRGERPTILSKTLKDAENFGMHLHFVTRDDFRSKEYLKIQALNLYPDAWVIEEGGQNSWGIMGAQEILDLVADNSFSHIMCAVGTGTMMTGIICAAKPHQQVIGIPVLKISENNNTLDPFITQNTPPGKKWELQYSYHFGGYAKFNEQLISFMNELYQTDQLPTDFVYTAKLMFAVSDLASKNYFPAESKVLVIHSGGLQGNRSLPEGMLAF